MHFDLNLVTGSYFGSWNCFFHWVIVQVFDSFRHITPFDSFRHIDNMYIILYVYVHMSFVAFLNVRVNAVFCCYLSLLVDDAHSSN